MNALNAVHSMNHTPVLFPLHPRTKGALDRFKISTASLSLLPPQGYLQMMNLVDNCGVLITDSGGLQEESSYLGVPCITIRTETERPITIEKGSNVLLPPTGKEFVNKLVDLVCVKMGTRKNRLSSIRKLMGEGKSSMKIAKLLMSV